MIELRLRSVPGPEGTRLNDEAPLGLKVTDDPPLRRSELMSPGVLKL
jgi:hypothetical protein